MSLLCNLCSHCCQSICGSNAIWCVVFRACTFFTANWCQGCCDQCSVHCSVVKSMSQLTERQERQLDKFCCCMIDCCNCQSERLLDCGIMCHRMVCMCQCGAWKDCWEGRDVTQSLTAIEETDDTILDEDNNESDE